MDAAHTTQVAHSPWSPFRHATFTVIWIATLISNVGAWMYSAASAWLMTSLDADPLMVSLVQVAATLPMVLFALPAGALADIVDKRRYLIGAESFIAVASTLFAALVWLRLINPSTLLLFIFLIESGSAATAAAWQSVVPQLVPRQELPAAVAMNSAGINVSRALGPALGGLITLAFGIAAPFWVNGVSNLGVIGALLRWRCAPRRDAQLPAERFISALRTGVRHSRNNRHLRATLLRAVGFFLFASCYWALLPLVSLDQVGGGAAFYGILLGAIGASAIGGVFALPWLKATLGPNRVVAAGSIGTAVALLLYGTARGPVVALAASGIAGVCWIAVLSTLNVSAQLALPEWVRGRGLAVYVTVFFAALTLGSALWGQLARIGGVPMAHFIAAAGLALTLPLTRRWKLQTAAAIDLTPSMHWPTPVLSHHIESDPGPVLVTVEYRINDADREAFLRALDLLSHERGRDGAYAWGLFEDAAEPDRFLETFLVESWLEHLRQHKRVTNADRALQQHVHRLLKGPPTVTHLVEAHSLPGKRDSR
ncbi:MAG TPA: MFS transporter [Steroidobacteraceae bacterium]|nr:MFS transporter [Steroidobacteraceae bacterium]